MSSGVKQPIGQKRLTNVAVVRYKKKGKRFEVACYKNKIVNWRNGIEKDLDEVLQTTTVFVNVSKGVLAKHEDLVDVFGTADEEQVCRLILAEGDTQISDKERELEFATLFKDVAGVLADKCINPDTQRPYTLSMVERALRDVHFSVDPKRGAKQQALQALPQLQAKLRIERARMRLRILAPLSAKPELDHLLDAQGAAVEYQDLGLSGQQLTTLCLAEPGCYRTLHAFAQSLPGGRLEVVALAATGAGSAQDAFDAPPAAPPPPAGAAGGAAAAPAEPRDSETAPPADARGPAHRPAHRRPAEAGARAEPDPGAEVLYAAGPVAGMPERFAARRARFADLDGLQPGWRVELRGRGGGDDAVDALFFSPASDAVGSFANARRAALAAHKQSGI